MQYLEQVDAKERMDGYSPLTQTAPDSKRNRQVPGDPCRRLPRGRIAGNWHKRGLLYSLASTRVSGNCEEGHAFRTVRTNE
jgi:hypothetical protein